MDRTARPAHAMGSEPSPAHWCLGSRMGVPPVQHSRHSRAPTAPRLTRPATVRPTWPTMSRRRHQTRVLHAAAGPECIAHPTATSTHTRPAPSHHVALLRATSATPWACTQLVLRATAPGSHGTLSTGCGSTMAHPIPVVPHKAVAEVSEKETCRRD